MMMMMILDGSCVVPGRKISYYRHVVGYVIVSSINSFLSGCLSARILDIPNPEQKHEPKHPTPTSCINGPEEILHMSTVDDPLNAALAEAETLMESLEDDAAAFVIDEDDEVEEQPASTTPAPKSHPPPPSQLHPLHDTFLSAPSPQAAAVIMENNITAGSTFSMNQQQQVASTTTTTPPPGQVASMNVGVVGTTPAQQERPQHFDATQFMSHTSVNMDAFKASTTKFASNLASMAQRAVQLPPPTNHPPTTSTFPMNPVSPPTDMIPSAPTVPELDADQKANLIQTHFGDLIPGERIIMFLSNLYHVSDSTSAVYKTPGWCCVVTFYRIILFATDGTGKRERPDGWGRHCWPPNPPTALEMPLACIERVEKTVLPISHSPTGILCLTVTSKMGGHYVRFGSAGFADTNRAFDSLMNYAFPGRRNLGYLFAFESKRDAVMASVETDATTGQKRVTLPPWTKRFDAKEEFQRQFERGNHTVSNQAPWSLWQSANINYQLCSSYPSLIAGPATLDETMYPDAVTLVRQCAAFRSEQRLPALTWCGRGGGSIWRCSQPKVGLQGNRSTADELFFKHILERSAAATALDPPPALPPRSVLVQLTGAADLSPWLPQSTVSLKILDLRPRSSAMANRTAGYGYENTSNYMGCSLQFCGVGNIHAVRDAYQKLSNACLSPNQSDVGFTSAVEDSKWLTMIRLIWSSAWETAYWVHMFRLPVVLHCSHGWDRTSQAGALAQILLDPYFRTKKGFACLVEKDFMSFGHPFHLRCGHGESSANSTSGDEGQNSPIFLQFLDCVYQIVKLMPEAFEYNRKYVLEIADNLYSCRFGNFLCDTEREREVVASLRQRTHSLWDYLDESEEFTNENYQADEGVMLVPISTMIRSISLWTELFCRYGAKPTERW